MWSRIKTYLNIYLLRFKELFWQFYDEVLYEINNPSFPQGSLGAHLLMLKKELIARLPDNVFGSFILKLLWPFRQLFRFRQIMVLIYRKFFRFFFHTVIISNIMHFLEQYFFVFYYLGFCWLALYFYFKPSIFDPRILNLMFLLFFCTSYFLQRLYLLTERSLPRLSILLTYLTLFVMILFFFFSFQLPGSIFQWPSLDRIPEYPFFFLTGASLLVCFIFVRVQAVLLDELMDYTHRLLFFFNMINLFLFFVFLGFKLIFGEIAYFIDLWTYYRLFSCFNISFFLTLCLWRQSSHNLVQRYAQEEALFYASFPRAQRRFLLIFNKNIWIFNKGALLFKISLIICTIILVFLLPHILFKAPISPLVNFLVSTWMYCFWLFIFLAILQVFYVNALVTQRYNSFVFKQQKKR